MSNVIGSHYLGRKLNREIGVAHADFHRNRTPKGRYGWKYCKPDRAAAPRRNYTLDRLSPPLQGELNRLKALLGM